MKNLLVIGGAGALGKAVINTFKPTWAITSIDLINNP